ncbi:MAG: hypothetical protein OXG05_06875 [Gammaproteobacteria bacterium]|nr:hypothetical protein [Gammaproteobacteria bacterium]
MSLSSRFLQKRECTLGFLATFLFVCPTHAQFDRTYVNFSCPCTLQSGDGETAELTFGLVNYTDADIDELHVTIGIVTDEHRESESEDESDVNTAFLDTVALEVTIDPQSTSAPASYEIELGVVPEGSYYFELLLHDTETPDGEELLDSVWFKGLHETPPETLDLVDANYLVDSDGDGVGDLNEEHVGTDPSDPDSTPEDPTIDILFLFESDAFEHFNTGSDTFLSHIVHVTNDMYEKSESPIKFRAVGALDETTVQELASTGILESLEESQYLDLIDEYQADLVAVFRPTSAFLCGFAVSIGGLHGRGFLHPDERFPYIEMFLDPETCSIDTTAHEIGHLIGLGHSFEQFSVGAFPWSRGHAVFGEFGTIMSYARQLFAGVGLDVFSSPHLDCLGKSCGIPHTEPNAAGSADAVQTINVLKYQFAQTSTPDPEFDYDGDGVGAVADAFPIDPDEWADTDGDQFGDNVDAFPEDPLEWLDTDGDGIGNNTDPDIDNDGIENFADPDPFDPAERDLRLTAVTSNEADDQFGYFATTTIDLDEDDVPDLAVSAPTANNETGEPSGKVYLLALNDVVTPALTPDAPLGAKSLADVLSAGNSWELRGLPSDTRFGEQIAVLEHTDGETELAIRSVEALYLITLDATGLTTLSAADGTDDRQITLDDCESLDGCVRLEFGTDLNVTDVSSAADFDEDGRIDVGVVGYVDDQPENLLVYFLSRAGFSQISAGTDDDPFTLVDLFEADEASFVITTSGTEGVADLEFLGGTLDSASNDLVLSIWGNEAPGRLYVIGGEQLRSIGEFDDEGDRSIDVDSLVGLDQTYRVTNEEDSDFGFSVDVLSDLDEDGRNDLFVWGNPGNNYMFTIGGIRFHDLNDLSLDGSVVLPEDAHEEFGTWLFNRFGKRFPLSSSGIIAASEALSFDQLAFTFSGSMFVAGLRDLDYLDDPSGEDLNGVVNIPIRGRFSDIYAFRAPFGPSGPRTLAGVTSIGDIDDDATSDFVLSVFSGETEGTVSTMYAVFTSELGILDQADGDEDHLVMLHNNMIDSDGDGIPNLHDDDDDNDGLRDIQDVYPHLAQFRFDADGDGYANAIDAFPLNFFEHSDIDFDGAGDRQDDDADGDGILNDDDEFPFDTDNDGIPNRQDPDDDNDLVLDEDDLFPIDASESSDLDGDGVGDNADEFDDDPTEAFDTDQDGVGNNADSDDDNDGYLDEEDAFPLDPTEWLDSDGDGFGDNSDQFPLDPLEWEDLDGDGLGDNHGSAAFNSYRLVTDWSNAPAGAFSVPSVEAYRLGDFDRDGYDDIEIANALANVSGQPWVLLSSGDLAYLDGEDGKVDKVVDITRIHQGPNSWRFNNTQPGFDSLKLSSANVGDLNGDGIQDLGLSNPLSYTGSGSVVLVYGGGWTELDQADGAIDGEIDFNACVESKSCTRIRSVERGHGFGLLSAPLANIFGDDKMSLAFGAATGQARRLGRSGIASAYLLSHVAIEEAVAASSDGNVLLSDVEEHADTYAFYPEFDGFFEALTFVGRVPDLDQDSVGELMLLTPLSPTTRIYILASSELTGMDTADFTVDGKTNLAASYRFANSYRIDDFELFQTNMAPSSVQEAENGEQQSYFLPLLKIGDPQTSHLVDLRYLADHDVADDTADGVVTTFDTSANYTWTFPNVGLLSVCNPNDTMGRGQVIASLYEVGDTISSSNPLELIVFDTEQLGSLDSVNDTTDGTIELDTILTQQVEDVWHLTFGGLTSRTLNSYVSCAGDFDADGNEDIMVSLTHVDGLRSRGNILLIARSDFAAIDRLDGEEDHKVNLELLWPGG